MGIKVFSAKVLIENTIFTSLTGDGNAILLGHREPREGLAACTSKGMPSFLSYFNTLSTGPVLGVEPTTSALQTSALLTEVILPRKNAIITLLRKSEIVFFLTLALCPINNVPYIINTPTKSTVSFRQLWNRGSFARARKMSIMTPFH